MISQPLTLVLKYSVVVEIAPYILALLILLVMVVSDVVLIVAAMKVSSL